MPQVLQLGSTGPAVEQAQYLLARRHLLDAGQIDGSFGPVTEQAVKVSQQGQGLTVDGIVGTLTWGALLTGYDVPPVLAKGSQRRRRQRPADRAQQGPRRLDPGRGGADRRRPVGAAHGASRRGVPDLRRHHRRRRRRRPHLGSPVGAAGAKLAGLAGSDGRPAALAAAQQTVQRPRA